MGVAHAVFVKCKTAIYLLIIGWNWRLENNSSNLFKSQFLLTQTSHQSFRAGCTCVESVGRVNIWRVVATIACMFHFQKKLQNRNLKFGNCKHVQKLAFILSSAQTYSKACSTALGLDMSPLGRQCLEICFDSTCFGRPGRKASKYLGCCWQRYRRKRKAEVDGSFWPGTTRTALYTCIRT